MPEVIGWQRHIIACFTHGTRQGEHFVTSNKTDETWVTDIATKNKGNRIPGQGLENTKKLSSLNISDHVRLHVDKTWSRKGKIIKKCEQPRSYFILTGNSRKLRYGRRYLFRIFPSSKCINTSPPEIPEHQPTTTEQMVRTRVRKVYPPRGMSEYI